MFHVEEKERNPTTEHTFLVLGNLESAAHSAPAEHPHAVTHASKRQTGEAQTDAKFYQKVQRDAGADRPRWGVPVGYRNSSIKANA